MEVFKPYNHISYSYNLYGNLLSINRIANNQLLTLDALFGFSF